MFTGKQEGEMTPTDERVAVIVKGFEQERDDTLADSPEVQRIVELTDSERRILAHAAVKALRVAGYEIVRSRIGERRPTGPVSNRGSYK
jgi:hypothetical protein